MGSREGQDIHWGKWSCIGINFSFGASRSQSCLLANAELQISIASSVTKHSPIYKLTVRHANTSGDRSSWKTSEITAPFARWFDADGYFVAQPFQQWLASEVPVIGQADPRNVVGALQETSETSETGQVSAKLSEFDFAKKSTQPGTTSEGTKSRKSRK